LWFKQEARFGQVRDFVDSAPFADAGNSLTATY
jgi:hypothetical protein